MGIKYFDAPDILLIVKDLRETMRMDHVLMDSLVVMRSHGSSSRGTIARCHALNKIMQQALGRKGRGFYVLEFISERYDKLSDDEKIKVVIHEMLHIPKSLGGGFIHHNMVNHKNIDKFFKEYKSLKNSTSQKAINFSKQESSAIKVSKSWWN